MPTPILYIGLGTSGMRMLEQTQRFYYSATGACRPHHTRFLFVETDATKEAERLLGAPEEGHAIEIYRTPIPAAGPSVRRLQTRATVRIFTCLSESFPAEAKVILEVREGEIIPKPLKVLGLPRSVFTGSGLGYAHIFSDDDDRIARAALGSLSDWLRKAGIKNGQIAVRAREDLTGSGTRDTGSERPILDVYVPPMEPIFLRRIEVLFNGVELVRQDERVHWLPDPSRLANSGAGAGGLRSFGRIALWGDSIQGQGCYLLGLRNKVRTLYDELMKLGSTVDPTVYICGTFTGGTNSGMFLDVAYLCRDIIDPTRALNAEVRGLFLLPPVQNPDAIHAANAYACLRDLRHFSSPDSQFLARWPLDVAISPFEQGRSPFELVTLFSLSWIPGANDTERVQKLYRVAGLFLFTCGTEFGNYRRAAVIDPNSANRGSPWKFSALGMRALFYPRGEIRQCAAARFARLFLIDGLWLLPNECRGLGAVKLSQTQSESVTFEEFVNEVKPRLDAAFAKLLEETVEAMLADGPGGQRAIQWFKDFLRQTRRQRQRFDESTLLKVLKEDGVLTDKTGGAERPSFYPYMRGRLSAIMTRFYQDFGRLISREIDACENLHLAQDIIDHAVRIVERLLEFWQPLGLTHWNAALSEGLAGEPSILTSLLEPTGVGLLLQNQVRTSRFVESMRRMAIHFLQGQLTKLVRYLKEGNTAIFLPNETRPDPLLVPNTRSLELLKSEDGFLASVSRSLQTFETQVAAGVQPNDKIEYHFQHGGFAEDVAFTVNACTSLHAETLNAAVGSHSGLLLNLNSAESLWSWLQQFINAGGVAAKKANVAAQAANCATSVIQSMVGKLTAFDLPSPGESGGIWNHSELHKMAVNATKDMSVNMGVNVAALDGAKNFPQTIVTGRIDAAETVVRCLRKNQFDLFQGNAQACDADHLEDMIIFWDERPVRNVDDLANLEFWAPQFQDQRMQEPSKACYIHT